MPRRYVLPLITLLAGLAINSLAADDDTALGYSTGLNGEVDNAAVALPPGSAVNVPNGVRPLIVLPPESLQPRTLVVPLPGERTPPVILRRNSIEAVPSIVPALPRSRINNGIPSMAPVNPSIPPDYFAPGEAALPKMPAVIDPATQATPKIKRAKSAKAKPGHGPASKAEPAPPSSALPNQDAMQDIKQDTSQDKGKGSTIRTRPLDPVLDF